MPESRPNLPQVGQVLRLNKEHYTVRECIYDGPFSNVYMLQSHNGQIFALKVEPEKDCNRPVLVLDVALLECYRGQMGFPQMIAKGRTKHYKYCMMNFIGPDIASLRERMPNRQFSRFTGYEVCLQLLTRLRIMHHHGWIHRDIKAQNLAVGLGHESHVVYILDFGLARRFRNSKGELVPLRSCGPNLGTYRYAPLAAGYTQDQGPKDDVEAWFYCSIDLIYGSLPWCTENIAYNRQITQDFKLAIHKGYGFNFFNYLPPQWQNIFRLISNTRTDGIPQYDVIDHLVRSAFVTERIVPGPLDWMIEANCAPLMNPRKAHATDDHHLKTAMIPSEIMEEDGGSVYADKIFNAIINPPTDEMEEVESLYMAKELMEEIVM